MQDLILNLSDVWSALLRDLTAIWRQSSSTVLVAFVLAIAVLFLSSIIFRILPQQRQHAALGAGVAFVAAFIGFLTGHVTGNSRTAVVGDITPVLLAGVGGLFVLSLSHERINSFLAGTFVMAFGMTFFQGTVLGSYHRTLTTNVMVTQQATEAETGNDKDESPTADAAKVIWGNLYSQPPGDLTDWRPNPLPMPTLPMPALPTLPFTAMPTN